MQKKCSQRSTKTKPNISDQAFTNTKCALSPAIRGRNAAKLCTKKTFLNDYYPLTHSECHAARAVLKEQKKCCDRDCTLAFAGDCLYIIMHEQKAFIYIEKIKLPCDIAVKEKKH